MVVVDGVRYREDEAPASSEPKATTPKNKARSVKNKEG